MSVLLNSSNETVNFQNESINSLESSGKFPDNLIDWILLVYFCNLIAGAIFNLLTFITLLRHEKNGLSTIILQLSAADLLTLFPCVIELTTLRTTRWFLPDGLCPVYSGSEVFTGTLTVYLIILLNFHAVTLNNLDDAECVKNPLNCDASSECLVRNSRNLNYRKLELSVIVPSILTWVLCASLAAPQFALSTTLNLSDQLSCTLPEIFYGFTTQISLVIFKSAFPLSVILIFIIILIVNIYKTSKNCILNRKVNNLKILIFCLVLNFIFMITSAQKLIHYFYYNFEYNKINEFPILETKLFFSALWSTMLYQSMSFLKFPLYILLLPEFKNEICKSMFSCLKK